MKNIVHGLLCAGVVVMAAHGYEINFSEQDAKIDNFHTVVEGKLYRSGQIPASRLPAYIKKFGIKTVVNLRSLAERLVGSQGEDEAARFAGAVVVYAPLRAGRTSTQQEVDVLLTVFKKSKQPLLVHCSQGINRTGEACALWLLECAHATKDLALTQFDARYGYNFAQHPEKKLFIQDWKKS